MSQEFNAMVVRDRGGDKPSADIETLGDADLPALPVTVDIAHSTMNYKDALAVTGSAPICRVLPMVCGIDLAGTVASSEDERFATGDAVLVNGYGLSEKHWGGYSQRQKLDPDWIVKTPAAFSSEQAMAIGTAGYTAMLSVMALQDQGVKPEDGPIAVSGASGGVGSIAIMLLAKLGYEATAISGRPEENKDYFSHLGARDVAPRSEFEAKPKPLEKERFAGAVDSVGSTTLASLLAQTRYGGAVAACGLAGGADLPSTVMPFILRGVTLCGIDSVMAPMDRRVRAWAMLEDLIDTDKLTGMYAVKPLSEVKQLAGDLLGGKITGRLVIDVNA